jgi:hypothetical protein
MQRELEPGATYNYTVTHGDHFSPTMSQHINHKGIYQGKTSNGEEHVFQNISNGVKVSIPIDRLGYATKVGGRRRKSRQRRRTRRMSRRR